VERERKRQEKKERERKIKSDLRAKMSVIASTDINNTNDDVLFDRRTLERLRKVDIEELEYDGQDSDEQLSQGDLGGAKFPKDLKEEASDSEDSDDLEPEQRRIEEMAAGVDEYYQR